MGAVKNLLHDGIVAEAEMFEQQARDMEEMRPPTRDEIVQAIWDGRDEAYRRHGDDTHGDVVTGHIVREIHKLYRGRA